MLKSKYQLSDEALSRHVDELGRETMKDAPPAKRREAVHMITGDIAQRLANKALDAEKRLPGQGDWLGTVLACNAAGNKHARAIIEHKAGVIFRAGRPEGCVTCGDDCTTGHDDGNRYCAAHHPLAKA